jgi:S1-C subfamily serine protease
MYCFMRHFRMNTPNEPAPFALRRAVTLGLFALLAGPLLLFAFFWPTQQQPAEPSTATNLAVAGQNISGVSGNTPMRAALAPTATPLAADTLAAAYALQQAFINVFERAQYSVVHIDVLAIDNTLSAEETSGTGFIYDLDGHIITNAHVVADSQAILVTFRDGYVAEARLIGLDHYSDLAVIKVNVREDHLLPLTLGDSASVQVGQSVITIGGPFGLISSMTTGIISAKSRTLNASFLAGAGLRAPFKNPSILQVDAQINPGNSGGPLLDLNGLVIGVNTAIRSESGYFQGIGFAVPANTVKRVVPQLIAMGRAEYTWLGITSIGPQEGRVVGLTVAALAERYRLPIDYGVLVSEVMPNSPASKAGLRGGNRAVEVRGSDVLLGGDIIVAIDGNKVQDFEAMVGYLVANTSPGDTIELTIYREQEQLTLAVVLEARPN